MKITINLDELASALFRYCLDAARFSLGCNSSQKKRTILQEISNGIYNNKNIVLSVDSKEFPDRTRFFAALANAMTLFVTDQEEATNFENFLSIGTVEEKTE